MSFVQISIDFSFALRAFVRENRCLEPRTSSLIIPGCEKKWKKGQIRDFAGSNLILNNKPREKKKISNLVLARGKTLCNDSVTASSSTYDRRSSLSLSLPGWIPRSSKACPTRINGNKMNVTRDVHCSLAQLYYLSWYSATVTINYGRPAGPCVTITTRCSILLTRHRTRRCRYNISIDR